MPLRIFDDRKRELLFLRAPRRIVSLVPSDTLNLAALGAGERLVGRTRYCDDLGGAVIGGTKDVDVDAVAALEPDLIVANQEENSRQHVEALIKLQLPVYVAFPKTVADGLAHLARLSRIVECGAELVKRGYLSLLPPAGPQPAPLDAFVPIWMEPLMTIGGDTFIGDALRACGARNVFEGRVRRYPLSADLGLAPPNDPGDRDTRYPRVTLDEVRAQAPQLVLLPDEPHPFTEADARALAIPGAKVRFCSGRDLSWYGAQSIEGIPRLRALIDSLR
jgi:ABC-type Fe3+-hydroxamate transport system substrate-binding protein